MKIIRYIIGIILLCYMAFSAQAQVVWKQTTSTNTNVNVASPVKLTGLTIITPVHELILCAGWNNSSTVVTPSADTFSLTWTPIQSQSNDGTWSIQCWSAPTLASTGTEVVTLSWSGGGLLAIYASLKDYTGLSGTLDQTPLSAHGTSTSPTTSNLTTSNATDLVSTFTLNHPNLSGTWTVTSPWTNRLNTSWLVDADQIVTSTGSFSAPATSAQSVLWLTTIFAFQATSGPPVVVGLSVSPKNLTVQAPGSQQFTCVEVWSDGHSDPCVGTVWASTNGAAATIDASSGLATVIGNGTTTISATESGVSASTLLTGRIPMCHAIAPSLAGTGDGSSWANAIAWNSSTFPFTITPGDTYYISGGDYTSTLGTVFTSSDQNTIATIKKATNSDFGSSCTASIGSGWNNTTMGTPVAHWELPSQPGGIALRFNTGGFIFDGSTGDGTSSMAGQYGFFFHYAGAVGGAYGGIVFYSGTSTIDLHNLTLTHWELDGGDTYAIPYTGVNGTVPSFFTATTGLTNYNFTSSYFYIHDVWFPFQGFNMNTVAIHHGWVARNRTGSAHSGGIYFKGAPNDHAQHSVDNLDIHNMVFEDIEGTGGITAIWGQGNNWNIYNNVWFNTGQPINIASISRTSGVVTAVLKNAVPQGAGASQWQAGRTWFKVVAVTGGTNCSSADTSAPVFTCWHGTFQPVSISSDGLTVTWNQAACLNLGNPFNCRDESGTPNTGVVSLHGQGGVNYVVGENGDGISNLYFYGNTIANIPVNGGIGCKAYPLTGTGVCNIENNLWYTSQTATQPARVSWPDNLLQELAPVPIKCTGNGTPAANPACTSGSGNLNGAYQWYVTNSPHGLYGQGNETHGWPHPALASPVNQQVSLNWNTGNFPYVNVYRTKAGGSTLWLIAQVYNDISTCRSAACLFAGYLDNIPDSSLGGACGSPPVPPCQQSPPPTNTVTGIGFHDYNTVMNMSYSGVNPSAHDLQYSSGILDPFIGSMTGNLHLTNDTATSRGSLYLQNGITLTSPFSSDFDGNMRTVGRWDRGAYQFSPGTAPQFNPGAIAPAIGMFARLNKN